MSLCTYTYWSKLIQITYEGREQGKQSSFSIQPLYHQRKIRHLWALFISCKLISSEVRFPSKQAFPTTIVATIFSSRGRGHTCQSWGSIQGLCLTAPVTTGQCAAAAQRTLCPTDTVTTQDSRSPTSTPDRWGTPVYNWCQNTASGRLFFRLHIV